MDNEEEIDVLHDVKMPKTDEMIIPEEVRRLMEEDEDDAFCLELYEQYLVNRDNEETVSFEDAAEQLGVAMPY